MQICHVFSPCVFVPVSEENLMEEILDKAIDLEHCLQATVFAEYNGTTEERSKLRPIWDLN